MSKIISYFSNDILSKEFNLIDIYRTFYLDALRYTRKKPNLLKQARLDFILI